MDPEIVLIGGVSGSGKSVALGALEDAGYYTVNNLPLPMLPDLVRHVARDGFTRIGITIDAKTNPTMTLEAVSDGTPRLMINVITSRASAYRCPLRT